MTAAVQRAADRRIRELAAIHVGKKQLGIDRETYVALLQRISGHTSSADLDARQRQDVIEEMRRLGAVRPASKRGGKAGVYPGRPHNADSRAMPEMITKIEAQLTDMGLSWAYADAIVKRMHGIEKAAWCRKPEQLRGVIAALHVEQEKRDLNEAIDAQLKALGMTDEQLEERVTLRAKWRRHRPTLRAVLEWLGDQQEAH